MNITSIKKQFAPFLWSYDIRQLDLIRDKKRIITNVLNYGTKKATDLLLEFYPKKELIDAITNPLPGEWSKRSINYWSIIFKVKAGNLKRVIK